MDMDKFLSTIAYIVGGAFVVAIVATVLSKNAQTTSVIQASATGLASVIQAAVAPVSGGTGTLG